MVEDKLRSYILSTRLTGCWRMLLCSVSVNLSLRLAEDGFNLYVAKDMNVSSVASPEVVETYRTVISI